jgi:glycosyltransferase involved in cell wall biosynthesis
MSMRVLHVLCDLNGGGAERLVLDLCRHAPVPGSNEVAVLHGATADGSVGMLAEYQAAQVAVFVAGRIRGTPGALATRRLAAKMSTVDMVHTHLWAGDLWGRVAARLAGRRCVVTTEHNTVAEAPWRQALSRRMAPLSRRIVCVSEGARQASIAAGWSADALEVIENGIDVRHFAALPIGSARQFENGPLRLLAVGRLTPQKGFDRLLDWMERLPGFQLDVLGEGEDGQLLRARAARLPVYFHGRVADVRPWLAQADVLVMPSRWEGFGLAAVEAMAAGLPVVASDVPGLREVVAGAGLLVHPADGDRWVGALLGLAADAAVRRRMSEAGRVRASSFDIQRTAERYAALYKQVLAEVQGPY